MCQFKPVKARVTIIETSQLIFSANKLSGFYMKTTIAFNESCFSAKAIKNLRNHMKMFLQALFWFPLPQLCEKSRSLEIKHKFVERDLLTNHVLNARNNGRFIKLYQDVNFINYYFFVCATKISY